MASFAHSHNHPPNNVAIYRRPPHTMRRTATAVLAGGIGWYEPQDLVTLRSAPTAPSPALSASATLPAAPSQPLRDANNDSLGSDALPASRRNGPAKGGARAKGKGKPPALNRPVDMGVSIRPICKPGTGTPSPSPEPSSPPPHSHAARPPHSYASSSSSLSFSFAPERSISVARNPRRSDFDTGASRADIEDAAANVGKRSRSPSQSQRIRLPITPPVTSPYTSQSELPGLAPLLAPTSKPKRARDGREAVRRKRRKTGATRGEAVDLVPDAAPAPAQFQDERVDAAVHPPPPPTKSPRQPPRRKGWKGWVMVSDTEGSDAERPATPPVVILEKRTRSGRDFEQDLPPVNRRARSTASARSARTESVAPPSSGIAT